MQGRLHTCTHLTIDFCFFGHFCAGQPRKAHTISKFQENVGSKSAFCSELCRCNLVFWVLDLFLELASWLEVTFFPLFFSSSDQAGHPRIVLPEIVMGK